MVTEAGGSFAGLIVESLHLAVTSAVVPVDVLGVFIELELVGDSNVGPIRFGSPHDARFEKFDPPRILRAETVCLLIKQSRGPGEATGVKIAERVVQQIVEHRAIAAALQLSVKRIEPSLVLHVSVRNIEARKTALMLVGIAA